MVEDRLWAEPGTLSGSRNAGHPSPIARSDLSRPISAKASQVQYYLFLALGEFQAKRPNSASWWNIRAGLPRPGLPL